MGDGGLVSETIAGCCHIAKLNWRSSQGRTKKKMGALPGHEHRRVQDVTSASTLAVLPSIDSPRRDTCSNVRAETGKDG